MATWQALGDTLVTLPIAYHLEAQGHAVAVINTRGHGIVQRRQYIETLPTYPRFGNVPWGRVVTSAPTRPLGYPLDDGQPLETPVAYGRVVDLTTGPGFPWTGRERLCEAIAAGARMVLEDTPRVPILARLPEYRGIAERLTGSGEAYTLIAVEGSHPDRSLSQAQVAALADVARTVLVHAQPREYDCDAVNLTGRTTLEELQALVCCASAVVSVDTGAWHLAPAYHTPTLGVVGATSNPAALSGYQPAAYVRCRRGLGHIPAALLAETLETLLLQRPLTATRRPATGLRWWETVEVQTRLAWAAEYQARLLTVLGGSAICEV